MIRGVDLSLVKRKSLIGIGLAVYGAIGANGAFAQSVMQTLTLTFPEPAPVPIGGWTAAAIAVVLALAGGFLLRHRLPHGAWFGPAVLLAVGTLLAVQPIRSAQAIITPTPLNLVTSPATLQFTFPGAPAQTNVLVTNDTGGTTTILSIVLSPGPYSFLALPNPCTVGLVLAPGATCMIGLTAGTA